MTSIRFVWRNALSQILGHDGLFRLEDIPAFKEFIGNPNTLQGQKQRSRIVGYINRQRDKNSIRLLDYTRGIGNVERALELLFKEKKPIIMPHPRDKSDISTGGWFKVCSDRDDIHQWLDRQEKGAATRAAKVITQSDASVRKISIEQLIREQVQAVEMNKRHVQNSEEPYLKQVTQRRTEQTLKAAEERRSKGLVERFLRPNKTEGPPSWRVSKK